MQGELVNLGSTPSKADLAYKAMIAEGWVPVSVISYGTSIVGAFLRDDPEPVEADAAPEGVLEPAGPSKKSKK